MAQEEHVMWPVQGELTTGRYEEKRRSTLKGTSFEDRQ